jgi:hypothetical protein
MNNPLVKTCSICGILKPLSAFTQMAGPEGMIWGNVCSSCRKIAKEKTLGELEGESTTDKRIGNKERAKAEADKKTFKEEKEQRAEEESERKKELEKIEKTTTAIKKEQEREHRESFLENRSYRDALAKDSARAASENVAGGVHDLAEKAGTDLSTGIAPQDMGFGKVKYTQGTIFKELQVRLGKDAPINKFNAWLNKTPAATTEKTSQLFNKPEPATPEQTKQAGVEFMEKKWGPRSR